MEKVTKEEVLKTFNEILVRNFNATKEAFYESPITILHDNNLDSIDFYELMLSLELHYETTIPDSAFKLKTVGEIIDLVHNKVK